MDYSQVLQAVKNGLTKQEAKDVDKINLSIALCINDLSIRFDTASMLREYSHSVSKNDRSTTLTGYNDDLGKILYIKAGSGGSEVTLKHKGLKVFLSEFDSDDATAGLPTIYAITKASKGFPVIKFNIPFETDNTLTVYYFAEAAPTDVGAFRNQAIIVAGTIAYFHGISTEKGLPNYINFKGLVKLAKGSDTFKAKGSHKYVASDHDKTMNTVARNYSNRRY